MAALNPVAFGPGNWPLPATLTHLSAQKQARYTKCYHFMAYVDLLSRSLPGYVSPAKFTIARWTALIGIFVPPPAFGGRGYTNPNGLRSVWSRRKSQMYDLILENRILAPAPNAPAAPAVGLGLGQTFTTNMPTAHTQMLQVVAAWAQAVADALDDDDEEEDDDDGEDDNEEEDAYDEAGDDDEEEEEDD